MSYIEGTGASVRVGQCILFLNYHGDFSLAMPISDKLLTDYILFDTGAAAHVCHLNYRGH